MRDKILKVIMVLIMVIGVVFSIINLIPEKTEALMTEELLNWENIKGGYAFWCGGPGQGCYTVTPDSTPAK